MIKFYLRKNINEKMPNAYGKYYAYPVVEETMDLTDMCKHLAEHNSGFSEAQCMGVMIALRKCVKEQCLAGKSVKIDNLCIFSLGIKNKVGAASEEEFSVSKNIEGVKLRCRATGDFSNENLNLEATLKKATSTTSNGSASKPSGDGGGGTSTPGGGSAGGGSGSSEGGGNSSVQ